MCGGGGWGSVEGKTNQSVGELVKMDLGQWGEEERKKKRGSMGEGTWALYIAGVANGVAKG